MSELAWIVVGGILMSAIALVGSVTLILKESTLRLILLPLVALASGTLLGGAFFHMIPASIDHLGNSMPVYLSLLAGFATFFALEQFLHWHHCHRMPSEHRPLTYLILIADGIHNLIGGLAVAGAFLVDIRLGISTWFVAAAHEVPQELGDFGILVHGGWPKSRALAFNFLSALAFLVGGLIAFAASRRFDVGLLVPFAAGNFIYIAASDLIPEIKSQRSLLVQIVHFLCFLLGLGLLAAVSIYSKESTSTRARLVSTLPSELSCGLEEKASPFISYQEHDIPLDITQGRINP